ncbi:MAG: hypothetical protein NVSMB6_21660 [Burkholderiaceae bacterium]
MAARLRQSVKRGGLVNVLHASDDELLMPVANKMIRAPSEWLAALGEVIVAVAEVRRITVPHGFEKIRASAIAKQTAVSLLSGEPKGVLLGNAAAQHPQAAQLHAAAQWIADATDAKFGYLTEGGNTVGGHLANALPANGANASSFFMEPKKAYLLFNTEPELDCANPQAARAALKQAQMVVVMSAFRHDDAYADVMLPIAPFTETGGTFVNCEGRAQSFNGTVKPLGETRPGWKVLRVLGNLLGLTGFDYETAEAVRNEVLGAKNATVDLGTRLNNRADLAPMAVAALNASQMPLERIADVPTYFADAIVRRAHALQHTRDAQVPNARISTALAQQLDMPEGGRLTVAQTGGSVVMNAVVDPTLPDSVVHISAAHPSTIGLGAMFGPIGVEKA